MRDIPRPAAAETSPRQRFPLLVSLPSLSSSPVPSVYSLSFLAIALISAVQLRGVYRDLSVLLSTSSSSSYSVSGSSAARSSPPASSRQHPPSYYYGKILAHDHLPSAASATTNNATTTSSSGSTYPAAASPTASVNSSVAAETTEDVVAFVASDKTNDEVTGETAGSSNKGSGEAVEGAASPDDSEKGVSEQDVADPAGDAMQIQSLLGTASDGDKEAGMGSRNTDKASKEGAFVETPRTESTLPLNEAVARLFEANATQPTEPGGSTGAVYYSAARTDRAGATIRDMVLALAYGYANNRTYGGACYVNTMMDAPLRQAHKEALIRSVGLQDVLRFACPDSYDEGLLQTEDYASAKQRSRLISPQFVNWLRSKVVLPELSPESSGARGGEVVVHIRRGDVDPCNEWVDRYLPNSYYLDVLQKYVPRDLNVTVFSESWSFETFADFPPPRYAVRLDTDLAEVWRAVVSANYVVLSFSSFVYIPAVLNPNATVLYAPTWQFVPMPSWIKVDMGLRRKSTAKVKALAKAKCASHESLPAGMSMARSAENRSLIRES